MVFISSKLDLRLLSEKQIVSLLAFVSFLLVWIIRAETSRVSIESLDVLFVHSFESVDSLAIGIEVES